MFSSVLVAVLAKEYLSSGNDKEGADGGAWARRVGDALVLIAIIGLSALALAFLAVAAPLVLSVSALIGLIAKNGRAKGWRPSGA